MAVDVRLRRHVVGEAKQVFPAHVGADYHCVNEVRSNFCNVQVVEEITNKADGSAAPAVDPLEVFGGQNFVFGKKMYRENTRKKLSLSYEASGHVRSLGLSSVLENQEVLGTSVGCSANCYYYKVQ